MNDYERNFGEEQPSLYKFLELLAVMITLATIAYTAFMWPGLPERIATHFNARGEVDGYGGKWTLLLMLGIMMVMNVLDLIVAKYPKLYNYPVKITNENRALQYDLASVFVRLMILESIIMLSFIQISAVQNALNSDQQMNATVLFAIVGVMIATTVRYIYKAIKYK